MPRLMNLANAWRTRKNPPMKMSGLSFINITVQNLLLMCLITLKPVRLALFQARRDFSRGGGYWTGYVDLGDLH
jgi:hypothetical protein